VFNRSEVVRAVHSGYIPVKVNVDQDRRLADHYGVTSWPTDVIVDESGRVVHRQTSPAEAHQYVAFLDSIKTHHAVALLTSQPASATRDHREESAKSTPVGSEQDAAIGRDSTHNLGTPRRSSSFELPAQSGPSQLNISANQAAQNPLAQTVPPQQARVGQPYANPFLTAPAANPSDTMTTPQHAQPAASAPAGAALGWQPPAARPTAPAQSLPNTMVDNSATGAAMGWRPPAANPATPEQPLMNTASNNLAATHRMPSQFTASQPPTQPRPTTSSWESPASRQAMMPAAPQRPPLPSQSETIGLESYCPVTLVERDTWAPGDRRWGANHRGRLYLFANPESQQQFFANPDKYAPALSGYDPVHYVDDGMIIDGKRRHGLYYGSKYFLFAGEATLQKFQSDPNRYLPSDVTR
jgi:YHS domain-containing protein